MEKIVFIPLHLWKAEKTNVQTDVSSPLGKRTESTNEKMSFFNSLPQSLKSIEKHSPFNNTSTNTRIRQFSNYQSKRREYLLDDFKKDSKAKK